MKLKVVISCISLTMSLLIAYLFLHFLFLYHNTNLRKMVQGYKQKYGTLYVHVIKKDIDKLYYDDLFSITLEDITDFLIQTLECR
jgi:hypothetical protein